MHGSGFRVQGSGFRVQGAGFRVHDAGFRVQGSGLGVQSSGCRAPQPLTSLPRGREILLFDPTQPPALAKGLNDLFFQYRIHLGSLGFGIRIRISVRVNSKSEHGSFNLSVRVGQHRFLSCEIRYVKISPLITQIS